MALCEAFLLYLVHRLITLELVLLQCLLKTGRGVIISASSPVVDNGYLYLQRNEALIICIS